MDTSEQVAHEYLLSRFTSVVYEPDGNIPPDFLADSRIAVEVRRLNQNKRTVSTHQGLEEVRIPLWRNLRTLLQSLGPPTSGKSWFVFFRFQRPVEKWKVLRPLFKSALVAFRDGPAQQRKTISIAANFELKVYDASSAHSTFFVLGGCNDRDSGGWLLAEMGKNLQLCIDEKTCKIVSVRHKYPEWWLVLVDHIGYGVDDLEREMFRDQVRVEHDWDKVILLDPRNHHRAFEI